MHFPLAAIGDVAAAIFIVFAIVSAIVNFFKEKNAQADVEERQKHRSENQPDSQSEIESFLDEIGASQPSTDMNEQRQHEIKEQQQSQREELRRRQQQRRQQLQEQQRRRQAAQEQQSGQLGQRRRESRPEPTYQEPVVLTESDFIDEEPTRRVEPVSERHIDSAVSHRHVNSEVGERHMESAVAETHKLASKRKRAESPIHRLLSNKRSLRNAIVINEILMPPKTLR
jgi:hypothetical protein